MEINELNDNPIINDDNTKTIYKVNVCIRKDRNLKKEDLFQIQPLKLIETDNNYLASFKLESKPESGWSSLIQSYPKSVMIVDEYCESVRDNTGVGDLRYIQSSIYSNRGEKKIFLKRYNFDDLDILLELYPVHFGNIRIEELKSENLRLKSKAIKVENSIKSKKDERSKGWLQQWEAYSYIKRNKISRNVSEIRFIMSLWEHLNDELYGYEDKDLSMRYRGIDEFSPMEDISTSNRI